MEERRTTIMMMRIKRKDEKMKRRKHGLTDVWQYGREETPEILLHGGLARGGWRRLVRNETRHERGKGWKGNNTWDERGSRARYEGT